MNFEMLTRKIIFIGGLATCLAGLFLIFHSEGSIYIIFGAVILFFVSAFLFFYSYDEDEYQSKKSLLERIKKFYTSKRIFFVILLLFTLSRLALVSIGLISHEILKPTPDWNFTPNTWLDIWGHWDSRWYFDIAHDGYSHVIQEKEETFGQANYAFFPLYPLIVRYFSFIVGDVFISGVIVSNFFFLLGLFFLYKLFLLENNSNISFRAVLYALVFPSAFVFSGLFSESTFFALLILTFYFAKKDKWPLSGFFGFCLALSRSLGVFVFFPIIILFFQQERPASVKRYKRFLPLFFIPLGLVAFMIFNYFLTGDFFAFAQIQKTGWKLEFSNPWQVLEWGIFESQKIHQTLSALVTLGALLLFIIFSKKIGFVYFFLSCIFIVLPLISGKPMLDSMLRYILPTFPLYLLLAKISKNEYVHDGLIISLALLQGFCMVFWANDYHFIV